MPINNEQERYIIACIEHLLDFSTDKATLITQISNLKNALLNTLLPSDNEYIKLHECIYHPQHCLQNVEKQNTASLYVAEVKKFLMRFITDKVDEAALAANIPSGEISWDQVRIEQKIIGPLDHESIFVSIRARTNSGENPYAIPYEPGQIYGAELYPELPDLYLRISFNYPPNATPYNFSIARAHRAFQNDLEEDNYIYSYLRIATETSRLIATFTALDYLHSQHLVPASSAVFIFTDPVNRYQLTASIPYALRHLLTHRFYLSRLENKLMTIEELELLTQEQTSILLHPAIIELLKKNYLDIRTTIKLTPSELQVISAPHYFSFISQYPLAIMDFIGLTENQSKILNLPPVINFIKSNKLSINAAKNIPLDFKPLITNPFYYDKLMKESVCLDKFFMLDKKTIELMLYSKNIKLIADCDLSLDQVISDLPLLFKSLYGEKLTDKYFKKFISLSELEKIHQHIQQYSFIAYWIENDIIDPYNLLGNSITDMIETMIFFRIIEIHDGNPKKINHIDDSFALINTELQIMSEKNKSQTEELLNKTLEKLFAHIKIKIRSAAELSDNHISKVFYKSMIDAFDEQPKHPCNSNNKNSYILWTIIEKTKITLLALPPKNTSNPLLFMNAKKPASEELREVCEKLLPLEVFSRQPTYEPRLATAIG